MFHRRSLKLAALYLGIIMFISLFFSFTVYRLATVELDRGIRGPMPAFDNRYGDELPQQARNFLRQDAVRRSEDAKEHVRNQLIIINIAILVGAGFLSYYLAARTLRPIEEAHEAQSRFTGDASHELRTPIAAMRSEIEVALMDPKLKLSEAKKLLRSNLEELDKLTALSEGLLKLSRNEHGSLELKPTSVDKTIKEAIDRISSKADSKHINIDYKTPVNMNVLADADSLTELLVIILDNAIKYSPENSSIEVAAGLQRKRALISVTDHGVGILETDAQHIFDRFYRADSARSKTQAGGYGIGLSIAKQIADAHNGNINVTSTPGEGSTFTVNLPAVS